MSAVKLKMILSLVIAIAAGSSIAILVSTMLGIESIVPGVIGAVTGAVVVTLAASPRTRHP